MATTARREIIRLAVERTCHQRKMMQRFLVSQVKSIYHHKMLAGFCGAYLRMGVGERGNDSIRSCCTSRALCARRGPYRYDPYVSDPLLLFEKLEIW
jgi:hypothetical protein